MIVLDTSLSYLPATSSNTQRKFAALGLHTFRDLLEYYPFRHEDRRTIADIASLQPGETVTVRGIVKTFGTTFARSRMTLQKALIEDSTGTIEIVWFNQRYLSTLISEGVEIAVWGEVQEKGHKKLFVPKEFEVLKTPDEVPKHMGRVVAVYPERRGLSSKTIREKISFILNRLQAAPQEECEFLPVRLLSDYKLIGMKQAYFDIHIPSSPQDYENARRRLSFNELFTIQMCSYLVRQEWQKEKVGHTFDIRNNSKHINAFMDSFPFTLTNAQRRVTGELLDDLAKPHAMNRFVQGDVGSGKTAVAAVACFAAFLNGYRTLFMAPTEILALQHFSTLEALFLHTDVNVALKTGSKKISTSQKDLGRANILVGTHALLNNSLQTERVGLIVIDEQHRFGVRQRAQIQKKGIHPHLLTMTATPIPRTVALTLFSELDMSVIDEMPTDRLQVKSYLVPPHKRQSAYEWIRKQIVGGHQAFLICPLVDESEHDSLKSVRAASKEAEHLRTTVFPGLNIGLIHGKLKAVEKAGIMEAFKNRDIDILVSTSVVEVGIDIPNATVIVIEAAERFGLAQLHQLRGRVGRSANQSYCLLFTESDAEETHSRLSFFASHPKGIDIAQYDLEHRGPGQLYGTMQHGYLDLKIASLADPVFIELVKKAVEDFHSSFDINSFPLLRRLVENYRVTEIAKD